MGPKSIFIPEHGEHGFNPRPCPGSPPRGPCPTSLPRQGPPWRSKGLLLSVSTWLSRDWEEEGAGLQALLFLPNSVHRGAGQWGWEWVLFQVPAWEDRGRREAYMPSINGVRSGAS